MRLLCYVLLVQQEENTQDMDTGNRRFFRTHNDNRRVKHETREQAVTRDVGNEIGISAVFMRSAERLGHKLGSHFLENEDHSGICRSLATPCRSLC